MPTNSVCDTSNFGTVMKQPKAAQISQPHKRKVKMAVEAIAWKQMIALLCTRQVCRAEIREHTGLSGTTVNRWLAVLRLRPNNLVYISEFRRPAVVGPYTEYYSFGFCEQDVPRPPPLTKAQRNERAALRMRTDRSIKGVIIHESR